MTQIMRAHGEAALLAVLLVLATSVVQLARLAPAARADGCRRASLRLVAESIAQPRLQSFRATVAAVAAIATAIEALQFGLAMSRVSSVTDVLLPMIGGAAAWCAAAVLRSLGLDRPRQPQPALGALVEGGVAEPDHIRGGR